MKALKVLEIKTNIRLLHLFMSYTDTGMKFLSLWPCVVQQVQIRYASNSLGSPWPCSTVSVYSVSVCVSFCESGVEGVCPSRHIFYLKMPLIRAIKVPSWMRSVSLYQLLLSALWITLPAHCLLSSLCMVFSLASMPCYLIVALCNNKCKACLHPPCTPLQFFEMVIRFLAEGAASGLNVIAVYVTEILRVTGFDGG